MRPDICFHPFADIPVSYVKYLTSREFKVYAYIKMCIDSPDWADISDDLGMSRSCVFRVIKSLKDKDAIVSYQNYPGGPIVYEATK